MSSKRPGWRMVGDAAASFRDVKAFADGRAGDSLINTGKNDGYLGNQPQQYVGQNR